MKDNRQSAERDLEERLRRFYQHELDPVEQPDVLWQQLGPRLEATRGAAAQSEPARAGDGGRGGTRSWALPQELSLGLAGTLVLVLVVALGSALAGVRLSGLQREGAPFGDALAGVVAVRAQADPPGLYVYGETGWRWLEGSDVESGLRARCSNGDLLYDAPNTGAPVPTIVQPAGDDRAGPRPEDRPIFSRRLLRAGADGSIRRHLSLNPGQWQTYACGENGVAGMRRLNRMPSQGVSRAGDLAIAYQPAGSAELIVPTLPGENWYVLSATPSGGRILVAETEGAWPNWVIRVYSAGADGGNRNLLDVWSEVPYRGVYQLSPDGRYLLVTFYDPRLGPAESRAVLYDLSRDAASPRLAEYKSTISSRAEVPQIYATFLTEGPRAGQLLVVTAGTNRQVIRLADPSAPERPLIESEVPGAFQWPGSAIASLEDTGFALSWTGEGGTGKLVYVDPEGVPQVSEHPSTGRNTFRVLALGAGYLVYRVAPQLSPPGVAPAPAAFALTLAMFESADARPLLTAGAAGDAPDQPGVIAWWFGTQRYAYLSTKGDLRVRGYDGSGDVLVETGVSSASSLWADMVP